MAQNPVSISVVPVKNIMTKKTGVLQRRYPDMETGINQKNRGGEYNASR
jgi:hypothetical protein